MNEPSSSPVTQRTPLERLALSRRAIVRHMHQNDDPVEPIQGEDDAGQVFGTASSALPSGYWPLLKQTVRSWWYHHPAKVAVEFASPLIGKYARSNPGKLLGVSAGVGAALVLFKPWRLISIGGILLAAIKSTDFQGSVMSMMTRTGKQPPDTLNPRNFE